MLMEYNCMLCLVKMLLMRFALALENNGLAFDIKNDLKFRSYGFSYHSLFDNTKQKTEQNWPDIRTLNFTIPSEIVF